MSTTHIPFLAEGHSVVAGLAEVLAEVLATADHVGLPQPRYAALFGDGGIHLQLPPEQGSIDAVRLWADTYCAAVRSDTHEGENGPEIWVRTNFEDDGVNFAVYAHVPVSAMEPVPGMELDSGPATDLPF